MGREWDSLRKLEIPGGIGEAQVGVHMLCGVGGAIGYFNIYRQSFFRVK